MTGYGNDESRGAFRIPRPADEGLESGGPPTCFEYIGPTALVLTGAYTGHRYYFRQPGARVHVDGRDYHALQAVPVLRTIAA